MPRANPRTGRGTALERRYNAWLTGLPCCLSARTDGVVRAHTGDHRQHKGLQQKAHLTTILPLQNALHLEEERGREAFWMRALGESPVPWAERLFDCFENDDREGADLLLLDMHERAMIHGGSYLYQLLLRAA